MCVCVCVSVCCGVHGAMVIVIGNGYGGLSSNPRRGCLHFTEHHQKGKHSTITIPALSKY